MGHENPLIEAYSELAVRIGKIRTLLETGVTDYDSPMDLAVAVLTILDSE